MIDLRRESFVGFFEHVFKLKSLLERLKRDFDYCEIVFFCSHATYGFLISTRYFAHLDGLSAENMIPHLLSFAISI